MTKKKINQKFYQDCRMKDFSFEELDKPRNLLANGIYKTKLTESDLPDSFVRVTHWVNFYYDMAGVKDVYYHPSRLVGDNTIKYDTIYISYDGEITVSEKPLIENNPEYVSLEVDWNSFDYAICASWGYAVFEKLKKYSPEIMNKIVKAEELYNIRLEEVRKRKEEIGLEIDEAIAKAKEQREEKGE